MAIDNRILVDELVKLKANFRRSLVVKDATKLVREEFPNWTTEEFVMVMRKLRRKYEFFPENLIMAMKAIYYNPSDNNPTRNEEVEFIEWSPMPEWFKKKMDTLFDRKKQEVAEIEEDLPF